MAPLTKRSIYSLYVLHNRYAIRRMYGNPKPVSYAGQGPIGTIQQHPPVVLLVTVWHPASIKDP